jgi:hypothetical protein
MQQVAEPYFTPAQAEVLFLLWKGPKTYDQLAELTGRSVSAVKKSVAELKGYERRIIDSRVDTDGAEDLVGRRPNVYFLIEENIVSTPDLALLLIKFQRPNGNGHPVEYLTITGYDEDRVERRLKKAESMEYLIRNKPHTFGGPHRIAPQKRLFQELRFILLLAGEFKRTTDVPS